VLHLSVLATAIVLAFRFSSSFKGVIPSLRASLASASLHLTTRNERISGHAPFGTGKLGTLIRDIPEERGLDELLARLRTRTNVSEICGSGISILAGERGGVVQVSRSAVIGFPSNDGNSGNQCSLKNHSERCSCAV